MTGMLLANIKAVLVSLHSAPAAQTPPPRDGLGRDRAGGPAFTPGNPNLKTP